MNRLTRFFSFGVLLLLFLQPFTTRAAEVPETLSLEVTVVRFKPAKATRILQGFHSMTGTSSSVISDLQKDGEVMVLYTGERTVLLETNAKAKFDALETRPTMIVGQPAANAPPITSYGLSLEIITRPFTNGVFALTWTGSISWSPEVIDRWKGDKFLSFVNSAASIAKQSGALGGDSAKMGTDIGLGFAQLFSPGGKPTPNEIYELPVNKTITFASSKTCKAGELIVNSTTAEMGSKEAQTILLLITPTFVK